MSDHPHYWLDSPWYRAQIAVDNRLEREQANADLGRERCDDEDERRIEAGIFPEPDD